MDLEDLKLVGCFLGRIMGGDTLKAQEKEKFEVEVGYTPQSPILVKGWMVWIFKSNVEDDKIL